MVTDNHAILLALLLGSYKSRPAAVRSAVLDGRDLSDLLAGGDDVGAAALQLEKWLAAGHRMLTFFDDEYPAQLRDVFDFPLVVFTRGHLVGDEFGVCVVGSRNASVGAVEAAREVATLLGDAGVCVVSGLAAGVDVSAHVAALNRSRRTVAVIGTGIDRYFPLSSRLVQQQIEREGLVLSQFWPGSPGAKHTFPMRNAVMSAYGLATIIIEASENSGTRHQATQAVRHGRPLVLSRQVAAGTSWGQRLLAEGGLVMEANSPSSAVDKALEMVGMLRVPACAV